MNTVVTSKEEILKASRELVRQQGWPAVPFPLRWGHLSCIFAARDNPQGIGFRRALNVRDAFFQKASIAQKKASSRVFRKRPFIS